MNRQIDGYCERTSPEFWAEPWNAVTNLSFILADVIALLLARRARRLDGPVIWLIVLLFVVGTGSFLFHTFATVWAAIADTAPIALFILSYFTLSMRCYGGYGWGKSLLLTLCFILALVGTSWLLNLLLRDLIGGSVSYMPALLSLFVVGWWLSSNRHPAGRWLISVGLVFAVSLTFRALDPAVCEAFPTGTHWLWHILNGVVLGSLTVAMIRHGERTALDARPATP